MTDNEPITLAEACKLFPQAKLTVSTLRAEAARGRLDIFRLGKRDCTTVAAMREMVRRCQDADPRRVSTCIQSNASGSLGTEHVSSAQAAVKQSAIALRSGLPRISRRSTSHNGGRTP